MVWDWEQSISYVVTHTHPGKGATVYPTVPGQVVTTGIPCLPPIAVHSSQRRPVIKHGDWKPWSGLLELGRGWTSITRRRDMMP